MDREVGPVSSSAFFSAGAAFFNRMQWPTGDFNSHAPRVRCGRLKLKLPKKNMVRRMNMSAQAGIL